nr:copia protein [Tanacetum cinerariifolium]
MAALDGLIGLCKCIAREDRSMVEGCYLCGIEMLGDTFECVRLSAIEMLCYQLELLYMSWMMNSVRDEVRESVDDIKYHGMIGSLLYLTVSRSDIMFSVCLCARFQKVPKTSHLEAVKRIFRYIKGTTHLGLWYPKGTGVETIIYADFDHAGDYIDRKSKSGVCTFIGCFLTSWFSKKQTALAISTTEAEYVFAEKAFQQDYG